MSGSLPVHGIHHVALRVTDLARSRAFYVEDLGFDVIIEGEGFCIVNAMGSGLGLLGPSTRPDDAFDPFRVGADHIALTVLSLADLEAVLARLNAANIRNNGIESDEAVGGTYISFYDPDGIAWEAFYLPTGGGS